MSSKRCPACGAWCDGDVCDAACGQAMDDAVAARARRPWHKPDVTAMEDVPDDGEEGCFS